MTDAPLQIIVDSREQRPWTFTNYNAVVTRACLRSGDYSLAGHEGEIALERKSLDDLVQSLSHGRTRFEAEVERLSAMQFAAVLVEASAQDVVERKYKSEMLPQSVLQSAFAWMVRYKVPVLWCGSRPHAEYTAFGLLAKFKRHVEDRQAEALAVAELEAMERKRRASRARDRPMGGSKV